MKMNALFSLLWISKRSSQIATILLLISLWFLCFFYIVILLYTPRERFVFSDRFFFSSFFLKNISTEKQRFVLLRFLYDFFGVLASVHCCSAITMTFEHNDFGTMKYENVFKNVSGKIKRIPLATLYKQFN